MPTLFMSPRVVQLTTKSVSLSNLYLLSQPSHSILCHQKPRFSDFDLLQTLIFESFIISLKTQQLLLYLFLQIQKFQYSLR